MMGIDQENRTELIDVSHDKITKEYGNLTDKILAHCQPLSISGATGIEYKDKFARFGINWKVLKGCTCLFTTRCCSHMACESNSKLTHISKN